MNNVMRWMTLWKFHVTVKSRTEAVRQDGDIARDGKPITFLGLAPDANKMAESMQHQLAPQHPDEDVTVRPVQAEKVGPHTIAQIGKLGIERENARAVAKLLAWRLAEIAAKQALELNPDIGRLANEIIAAAREQVARDLDEAAMTDSGVVVDQFNRPATA